MSSFNFGNFSGFNLPKIDYGSSGVWKGPSARPGTADQIKAPDLSGSASANTGLTSPTTPVAQPSEMSAGGNTRQQGLMAPAGPASPGATSIWGGGRGPVGGQAQMTRPTMPTNPAQQGMAQTADQATQQAAGQIPPMGREGMDEQAMPAWQQQWSQLWEQYNQAGEAAQQQTFMDEARAGRGMSAVNAMTGGSLGGAFAGGAGSVAVGGMQARLQAQQQHAQQGLELRMAYLDRLYADAEREDNQELTQWIENERNKTALDVAALQASGEADLETAQENANYEYQQDLYENDPDIMTNTEKKNYWSETLMRNGASEEQAGQIMDAFDQWTENMMQTALKQGPMSSAAKMLKDYEDDFLKWAKTFTPHLLTGGG